MLQLTELLFEYFLHNDCENTLKPYWFLHKNYLVWKEYNYSNCSCCKNLVKKEYICQICNKYHYCKSCWEDYTYFCPSCSKEHCFTCNVKRRACINCYRRAII